MVEQEEGASRVEEAIVRAEANFGLGLEATNSVEGFDVGLDEVAQDVEGADDIVFTGRCVANFVALDGVDVGFVDGDPEVAEVVEGRDSMLDVAHEETDVGGIGETVAVGEPEGYGEVVEGDDGADVAPTQIGEYGPVAVDG